VKGRFLMNVDALMHKLRQSRGRPGAIGSLQEVHGSRGRFAGLGARKSTYVMMCAALNCALQDAGWRGGCSWSSRGEG
jgi:hypothetical protein